jgi:hypothetical protein
MFYDKLNTKQIAGEKPASNKTKNTRKGILTQNEMRKMMKKITSLTIVILAILMAGCSNIQSIDTSNHLSIQGSGNIVSTQFDFTGFDRVEIGLAFGLTVHHGDEFKVTLTADDNFIDYILVEQEGSTLNVAYKPGYAYDVKGVTMLVDVTMPDLAGLTLGESSHTWLVNAKSAEIFEAELSGSSALEGTLQAVAANFELSGGTYLKLSGSAEQMRVESCGNSIADLADFAVKDAALEVSCNSITSVHVNGQLDVNASQHAQVFNFGTPVSLNDPAYERD